MFSPKASCRSGGWGRRQREKIPHHPPGEPRGQVLHMACPFPQTPHILDFEVFQESSSPSSKESEVCKDSSTDLFNVHVLQIETRSEVPFVCSFFNSNPTFSQTCKSKVPVDRNQQHYLSTACNDSNNCPSLTEALPAFESCLNKQIYRQ